MMRRILLTLLTDGALGWYLMRRVHDGISKADGQHTLLLIGCVIDPIHNIDGKRFVDTPHSPATCFRHSPLPV